MKLVYLFNANNGCFRGSYEAQQDPLEPDKHIAPIHSTDVAPPTNVGLHQVPVFNGTAWQLRPDNRGIWFNANREIVQVDDHDADVSALTRDKPPVDDSDLVGGQWVINEGRITQARLTRLRAVREQILNRMAGIALAAQLTGDTTVTAAYVAARQSLLDITKTLPSDLAGTRATVLQRYQAIVVSLNATAPALVSAFAGVDL